MTLKNPPVNIKVKKSCFLYNNLNKALKVFPIKFQIQNICKCMAIGLGRIRIRVSRILRPDSDPTYLDKDHKTSRKYVDPT